MASHRLPLTFHGLPSPSSAFTDLPWPSIAIRRLPPTFHGLPSPSSAFHRPSMASHRPSIAYHRPSMDFYRLPPPATAFHQVRNASELVQALELTGADGAMSAEGAPPLPPTLAHPLAHTLAHPLHNTLPCFPMLSCHHLPCSRAFRRPRRPFHLCQGRRARARRARAPRGRGAAREGAQQGAQGGQAGGARAERRGAGEIPSEDFTFLFPLMDPLLIPSSDSLPDYV